MNRIKAYGFYLTKPNMPLEKRSFTLNVAEPDQVIVKVAGCGLCHTDLSFLSGNVKTKKEFPIILGHEISGTIVEAGNDYKDAIGKNVVIPAVLPCGECEICLSGRDNICQKQLMPGNDFDGGFASHILVPGSQLCFLPDDLNGIKLSDFSVVADAITTPYQSILRSELKSGELAIVIGVGGVGNYLVQHAKNKDAKVIALDIDDQKLENAKKMGADFVFNTKELSPSEIKKKIRSLIKEEKLKTFGWKVFEVSGTASGQEVAMSLLSFAGSIGIVGFTMEKITTRISNAMAFDATIFGNWGCSPKYYSDVVKDVLGKKINICDNVESFPLDDINEIIPLSLNHEIEKRAIFIPNEIIGE